MLTDLATAAARLTGEDASQRADMAMQSISVALHRANARAIANGDAEFSVELAGRTWVQGPQKYHARSLKALRERYAALPETARLDPILEQTGCLGWLRGA